MQLRFRLGFACGITALLIGVLGCGGSGFETPEAAFRSLQIAANNQDMAAVCNCLTAESQDALAGMLVIYGAMVKTQNAIGVLMGSADSQSAKKSAASISAILDRHGVTEEVLRAHVGELSAAANSADIRSLATLVANKPAFIAEMYRAMQDAGQAANFSDQFEKQLSGELENVKIDGDHATGVVVVEGRPDPIEFRKTAAGWKLHINLDAIGAAA